MDIFRKEAEIVIGPPNGIVKNFKNKFTFLAFNFTYTCFFTDLKHLEGIKVSENGFEIVSSHQVENLNVIGPGLKKLFEMAGLDINIISDPTYKQELDNFVERNRKTLTRMSVRKPKGYKKQAYKNIGPAAPQSPPAEPKIQVLNSMPIKFNPLQPTYHAHQPPPLHQNHSSLALFVAPLLPTHSTPQPTPLTKTNIDRDRPKPKIGPKPNIGRLKTNTASGPKFASDMKDDPFDSDDETYWTLYGSKPNISKKVSPYYTSPIPTTSQIPTASPPPPPPPPPIPNVVRNFWTKKIIFFLLFF